MHKPNKEMYIIRSQLLISPSVSVMVALRAKLAAHNVGATMRKARPSRAWTRSEGRETARARETPDQFGHVSGRCMGRARREHPPLFSRMFEKS